MSGKHVEGDEEYKMDPPPKYDAPWYKGIAAFPSNLACYMYNLCIKDQRS